MKTTKRIFAILLCAVIIMAFIPTITIFAETTSGTCGTNVTWEFDSDTGTLTISGTGAMKDYYSYTSLPWYSYRKSITSIIISNSVTSIGKYAFYQCTSLISISIPDSITSIGQAAFYDCSSLTSISFPDSVTSIDSAAFSNCTSLRNINIPNSVTSIGQSAFCDCTSLQSISIPNSVTTIGDSAFYNTAYYNNSTNWTDGVLYINNHLIKADSVSISDSCEIRSGTLIIAESAFERCTSLTNISIPSSVTSIGICTFYGCTSLKSISFPNSVTTIGGSAFYGCTSLTSISFPDSMTSIGGSAFSGCTALTSISIPSSITSIDHHTFSGCTALVSISIPDSVTSIGFQAFFNCTSLASVNIPDSVTSIDYNAFGSCTSLASITIPSSVTTIGDKVFYYCTSLTSAYYLGSETAWNQISVGSNNSSLTSVLRYAVSDIEIAKWDSTNDIYSTDYDILEVFDNCSFSVEVIVPADEEHLTFTTSDWECPSTETSSLFQSSAIDFGEVTVSGSYALEDDENYNIYYVSVTGELKEKGDFTLTFTSPNDAVSATNISIERHYKIWTDSWDWQHSSFISFSADGARPYYLSKRVFSRVFSDSFMNQAIYTRERTIIPTNGNPAGECFGLVSSSALFYEGLPKLSLENSEADYAHEVWVEEIHNSLNNSLGLELHEFIEAVHVSQWTVTLQKQQNEHKNKYQDLINAVAEFESTGENPVIIGLRSNGSGHAVLGYKVEKLSDEYKVFIYDPNYPNDTERYISFTLNSKSVPTGWNWIQHDATQEGETTTEQVIWSSDDSNAYISYIDDLTYIYETLTATSPPESEIRNLFAIKSDNFYITNLYGNSMLWSNGTFSDETVTGIIPITLFHDTTESDSSSDEALFYYEGDSTLTFENDSDAESVELSVYDDYSGITITSDGHSVVEIGETDDVFDVTVTPSESGGSVTITYTTEECKIEVTGETDDFVSLQADSGESEITISGFTLASVTTEYGGITDTYELNSEDETVISVNTDNSAWSINSYTDGTVTLTAPSDAEGDYYVTIAQYDDDGILVDCEIAVLTAESEKTLYQITTEKALSTGKIKIMLWDKNLIPLTKAYEY